MEKRGERLQTSWEREQSACASKTSSGRKRISLLGRLLRGAMAVLLMAGLLPLVPGSPSAEEAEGLEGTTKYEDFFKPLNYAGEPASIDGNILRVGIADSYSPAPSLPLELQSCAIFVSKRPVSLLSSWEVRFTASSSFLNTRYEIDQITIGYHPGFSKTSDATSGKWVWDYGSVWKRSTGLQEAYMRVRNVDTGNTFNSSTVPWNSNAQITFRYDAKTDAVSCITPGGAITTPNLRSTLKNSAYLVLGGFLQWIQNKNGSYPPTGMFVDCEFSSMSLPNLTPEIRDAKIYRADGTEIGRDDAVNPGDKVRVACTVRNSNTAAVSDKFSEQFPMHVKLADTAAHPTKGLTPFADGNHPVQVNGSTVATSLGDDTIQGANGVPVTLVGNDATTVSWWATVSGAQGGAVTLSQQLIEDSFGGSVYSTVELVNERPLTPGGGGEGADPNDPSTWGDAGKDYHYTRLPAANVNGWNSSPVTVTFYPGDYDVMDLAPSQGSAKSLTAADPAWTQSADTVGIDLSAQAKNTDTGAVSVTRWEGENRL